MKNLLLGIALLVISFQVLSIRVEAEEPGGHKAGSADPSKQRPRDGKPDPIANDKHFVDCMAKHWTSRSEMAPAKELLEKLAKALTKEDRAAFTQLQKEADSLSDSVFTKEHGPELDKTSQHLTEASARLAETVRSHIVALGYEAPQLGEIKGGSSSSKGKSYAVHAGYTIPTRKGSDEFYVEIWARPPSITVGKFISLPVSNCLADPDKLPAHFKMDKDFIAKGLNQLKWEIGSDKAKVEYRIGSSTTNLPVGAGGDDARRRVLDYFFSSQDPNLYKWATAGETSKDLMIPLRIK